MFSAKFHLIWCNSLRDLAINISCISTVRFTVNSWNNGYNNNILPTCFSVLPARRLLKMFIAKSSQILHQISWKFPEHMFKSYILILCKLELYSQNFVTQLFDPKLWKSISRRKKFKISLSRLQKRWRHRTWFTSVRIV